jgi:hypothetical protein
MKTVLTRRDFLKAAYAGAMTASLPGLVWGQGLVSEPGADTRPRFFNPDQYATLEALVDRLIPPDTDPITQLASPGAKDARVADYIDFLLGAFLSYTPFIFAGGPFSDRNPVDGEGLTDDMAQPMSLTPNQCLAWRIRILGTKGAATKSRDRPKINIVRHNNRIAGIGDASGDVPGFQQQYTEGIAALHKAAMMQFSKDFPDLSPDQQDTLIGQASPEFVALVTSHAAEGMYSNPEYGGNQPPDPDNPATGADGSNRPIGWTIANFEGDRQPLGYTTFNPNTQMSEEDDDHPVSYPNNDDYNYLGGS